MKTWWIWFALGLCAWAQSYDLGTVLAWQRRSYVAAIVTDGFYSPRSVSRYRSRPGLHLGYDIAMPYGTPVLAAWAGTVSAIVPWYGAEYGVSVRHPDGTTATYGHISPRVQVGDAIQPGTVVGIVVSDHVDVKMRDSRGLPYDFGSGVLALVPLAPGPDPAELRKEARARLLPLLEAEARREAVASIPELEQRGLRLSRSAEPSRERDLASAWAEFRKFPAQGGSWPGLPRIEQQWQEARQALERASRLYAAGLISQKRWGRAVQEEQRRRWLAEIARAL